MAGTTQAQSGTAGASNCANGSNGTSFTPSLSSIFANPGVDYSLNPSWNGLDSVPAGAITLRGTLVESTSDLLGNARVLNACGTCTPGIQDRGAQELTGDGGVVPSPVIAGPTSAIACAGVSFSL